MSWSPLKLVEGCKQAGEGAVAQSALWLVLRAAASAEQAGARVHQPLTHATASNTRATHHVGEAVRNEVG